MPAASTNSSFLVEKKLRPKKFKDVIRCSYAGVGVVGLPIVDLGAVVVVWRVVDIITAVAVVAIVDLLIY